MLGYDGTWMVRWVPSGIHGHSDYLGDYPKWLSYVGVVFRSTQFVYWNDDVTLLMQVSFGVIGLSLGVTLLSWVLIPSLCLIFQTASLIAKVDASALCSYGFGAYFNILAGSEWSALMLTYGFPLAIIGMALKVNFTFYFTGSLWLMHYRLSFVSQTIPESASGIQIFEFQMHNLQVAWERPQFQLSRLWYGTKIIYGSER